MNKPTDLVLRSEVLAVVAEPYASRVKMAESIKRLKAAPPPLPEPTLTVDLNAAIKKSFDRNFEYLERRVLTGIPSKASHVPFDVYAQWKCDFSQSQPRAERAVCSPPELAMGYGIEQSTHDDKPDSYSSGVAMHELIDKYIKKSDTPPATDFASLSASQLATWSKHMYPRLRPLNLTKEPAMTTIKIETKTFISAPGIVSQDVTTLRPSQLANAIAAIDREIKSFEELSVKPTTVVAHIAQLKQGLADLVAAVDAAAPKPVE